MISKKSSSEVRRKKHRRLRNHLSGTSARPRLAVFRSNNHMYAQIIDDTVGNTLVAASTVERKSQQSWSSPTTLRLQLMLELLLQSVLLRRVSLPSYSIEADSFIRARLRLWQMQQEKLVWNSKQEENNT